MESHAAETLSPDMTAILADSGKQTAENGFSTLLIRAMQKGAEDGVAIVVKVLTVCAICLIAACLLSLIFGKAINLQELWDKISGLL